MWFSCLCSKAAHGVRKDATKQEDTCTCPPWVRWRAADMRNSSVFWVQLPLHVDEAGELW